MELRGFEPLTFSLRTRRATDCAIAPRDHAVQVRPLRRPGDRLDVAVEIDRLIQVGSDVVSCSAKASYTKVFTPTEFSMRKRWRRVMAPVTAR